ncbi:MAG: Si-specific NAD(P)(+) transhydrogenase [Acidobacteria bacterium]|nr:Si-specific NAD(P)(+) transhydrogenase [Acidobacteriota bacterium]
MSNKPYDLVVIGAGPAGVSGAATAASFGRRVALIERDPAIGGAGINTGTIPSKTLRETALTLSGIRARKLQIDLVLRQEATIADLMRHERSVTESARNLQLHRLRHFDVDLLYGTASFVEPHTVKVSLRGGSELLLRATNFLIACGSSPYRPPEFPFEDDRIHDSDEILDLGRIPRSLAVIGAGVIGCEYACTFAALGTRVWLIDSRSELMPFLDRDVARTLELAMEHNGVELVWNEKVASCSTPDGDEVVLTLSSGRKIFAEGVLVAAGRTSNTDSLNLAAAGISPGKRGVLSVNASYETEAPHIYAAGDVIGFPALASTSIEQARVAICHAFNLGFENELPHLLPAGIYTIPEVSALGETEQSLRELGIEYVVGRATFMDNPRGKIIGEETGFLKLIFRADDMKLLGAHVIGEEATELIHIGLMAMLSGSGADLFNQACFNYPTLGDLYKYATYDAMMRREMLRGGRD